MLPLEGVKILCVEQYGAAPWGTMHLADLGAEIIKLENPNDNGDMARGVGPYTFDNGDSQFYHSFNRNKRSLTLDLKKPEGRIVLHELVEQCDAVMNNLRGDLPARLGLDYESLCETNEAIVCVHLSAYGRDGPRASWPGYDYLMQAEAGYLSLTGDPEGPPSRFGLSMVDQMTGVTTAVAILSGIIEARARGVGRDLDVSLFDMALANLGYIATWYLNTGHVEGRKPRSAHPSLTPSQLYPTRDGWIFVMCNKEKFWPMLARALGREDLAQAPEFADFGARLRNRDKLTEILDDIFSQRTTREWIDELAGLIPVSPVYDVREALENPFVQERNRVFDVKGDDVSFRMVRSPITCPGEQHPNRAGPALGADTRDILHDLGYDDEGIEALRAKCVI